MKRILAVFWVVLLLAGCTSDDAALDRGMLLREKILKSNGCTFDTIVTADYGEKIYTFGMQCQTDASGNLTFRVTDPSSIADITGAVTEEGGKLTFDDQVLAFELLADGQITPVSAPWLLIHTLRSGYLRACEEKKEGLHIIIDDSYASDALQLDIYTDKNNLPLQGEILWQGRRIVSLDVRNFVFL